MASESASEIGITVNGEQRLSRIGSSLLELVETLGFAGRPIAVEIDGDVVPRSRLGERVLAGGERIEIVTFVGGG